MAKLIALYKKSADAAAFNSYYFSTHVPIAKKVPGLQRYEVSAGPVATPQGESPFNLANFAQAGVDLLVFDSKVI